MWTSREMSLQDESVKRWSSVKVESNNSMALEEDIVKELKGVNTPRWVLYRDSLIQV